MAKTSLHTHPNPTVYKIQQYVAVTVLVVMLVAVPLQLFLALALNGILFGLTAITLALLAAPVMMLLTVSPPVTLDEDGLHLQPLLWGKRTVRWHDIKDIKPYTLLPTAANESERRALQGRTKYRPAEGNMLVIPALPFPYRAAGFFAGEGGQPIIALTNRTHTDYDQLMARVERYWETTRSGISGK
jgi:hypothetical protein